MRCPNPKCKGKLLQKVGSETRVRIEHPITFDEGGVCKAKCYWCKQLVEVPLQIREGTMLPSEKFVLGKAGRKTA